MKQCRSRHVRLLLMAVVAAGAVFLTTATGMTGARAVSAATPTPSPSPYPPSAPTNVVAGRATSTSITLGWTASSGGCCGLSGYQIVYRPAFWDEYTDQFAGAGPDTTTVTITGLHPTWVYDFWVEAYDSVGHYSAAPKVTAVTPASDTGDTTPPPAPTDVRVTSADPTTVGLTWTPPADTGDVVAYEIYGYYGVSVGVSSSSLGSTTGTTFQAPVNHTYSGYVVRSRDAAGNLSLYAGPVFSSPVSGVPVIRSCRVSYSTSEWPHGFVSTIVITNTGSTAENGWTLTYTFGGDQRITNSWGGTATQSGAAVSFRSAGWNAQLEPGASANVGAQGTWNASDSPPTGFALDGAACTTG